MKSKVVTWVAVLLVLAEVLLVLLSWLLSATMAENVRSLLSSEGIRWFMGSFVLFMQSQVLIWILLLSMAYGCVRRVLFSASDSRQHRRAAWQISLLFLALYVGTILMLTVVPHAVLISATGHLFPSPFSQALVPIIAFGVMALSVVYGISVRLFRSLGDVVNALLSGIAASAPVLFLYVLFMQFYESLRFVFF